MKQRKQIARIPQGFEYLNRYVDLFLDEYPHIDRNVFVVMPFSTEASEEIYKAIERSLNDHGLIPLRADKHSFAPALCISLYTTSGSRCKLAIFWRRWQDGLGCGGTEGS